MSHLQGYITFDYAKTAISALLLGLVCWLANDKLENINHRLDRIEMALFIPATAGHPSQAAK